MSVTARSKTLWRDGVVAYGMPCRLKLGDAVDSRAYVFNKSRVGHRIAKVGPSDQEKAGRVLGHA